MNSETGAVYTGRAEIEAAMSRGEPLVPISRKAARRIKRGYAALSLVRAQERLAAKAAHRRRVARRRMQKASRRAAR